jgi:hypothetical protein
VSEGYDLVRRHLSGDPEATRLLRAEIVQALESAAGGPNKGEARRARAVLKRIPGHALHEQARAERKRKRKARGTGS